MRKVLTITASDPFAGEAGPDPGEFTISRSGGDITAPLSVSFSVTGSATEGTDYTAIGTTVTIPANALFTTLIVSPLADNEIEGPETVMVTLQSDPVASASLSIADDPPVVTVSATDPNAAEAGLNPGDFTISRSGGDLSLSLTVFFNVAGNALEGTDYPSLGTFVTLAANTASTTLTVTPLADNEVEGPEDVVVTLQSDPGYLLDAQFSATVTIVDDPPVVTITATDAIAAEAGPDAGEFSISRSGGNLTSALTVIFTVTGPAAEGIDFASLGTFVTIPAAQSFVLLSVVPLADNEVESPEEVVVTLQSDPGYTLGFPSSAGVTIADDAPVLTITASDPSAGEAGPDPGEFTISRSGGDITAPLTVGFSVTGSAAEGTDYAALGTSVTIPANAVFTTLIVSPLADNEIEGPETVMITLQSDPVASASLTIADDPLLLPHAAIIITESDGSTVVDETHPSSVDVYTVVLSRPPSHDVLITLSTDGQVALSVGSLTFTGSNWDIPQTVSVAAIDDAQNELSPHAGTIIHTGSSADSAYNLTVSLETQVRDNELALDWRPSFAELPSAEYPYRFLGYDPAEWLWQFDFPYEIQEVYLAAPPHSMPYQPIIEYDGTHGISDVSLTFFSPGDYAVKVVFQDPSIAPHVEFLYVGGFPLLKGLGETIFNFFHSLPVDVALPVASPGAFIVETPESDQNGQVALMAQLVPSAKRAASVQEAIDLLAQAYAANGNQPLDVVLAGHGDETGMSVGAGDKHDVAGKQLVNNDADVQNFAQALRGKVKTLTLLGCFVGQGLDRDPPDDHLMEHLASGLATPTQGVQVYAYPKSVGPKYRVFGAGLYWGVAGDAPSYVSAYRGP